MRPEYDDRLLLLLALAIIFFSSLLYEVIFL
jgi:hypothetical protein